MIDEHARPALAPSGPVWPRMAGESRVIMEFALSPGAAADPGAGNPSMTFHDQGNCWLPPAVAPINGSDACG